MCNCFIYEYQCNIFIDFLLFPVMEIGNLIYFQTISTLLITPVLHVVPHWFVWQQMYFVVVYSPE